MGVGAESPKLKVLTEKFLFFASEIFGMVGVGLPVWNFLLKIAFWAPAQICFSFTTSQVNGYGVS